MGQRERSSEFEAYLTDREDRTSISANEIEKNGAQAALDRCRALARQIQSDLLNKKADDFVDTVMELQAYLERAAAVLKKM